MVYKITREVEYAEDIANYMAEEINNNIELKHTKDMAKNNKLIKTFKWIHSVRSDEEWDHKWQLSALFPSMGLSRRYYHIYNNTEIYYDMWSNIHFGVIGRYCKFSEITLLAGADLAQRGSNLKQFKKPEGDTECDKNSIKIGFSIYDEYIKGILINAYNILSYVVNDNVFKYYFQNGKCPDE